MNRGVVIPGLQRRAALPLVISLAVAAALPLGACTIVFEAPSPHYPVADVDWPDYPIVVNGVGLPHSHATLDSNSAFPTHVPLVAVARKLDAEVGWDRATGLVTLEGRNGPIDFMVGEFDYGVDGRTVTLDQPSEIHGDEVYVPISFFREVFGMPAAYFSGGRVVIEDIHYPL